MKRFYSNGKLLLSGEYLILDGATGLAIPTCYGQDLCIADNTSELLLWESIDHEGNCWLRAEFDLKKMRIVYADSFSNVDGGNEMWAETLFDILLKINRLNSKFLKSISGMSIRTTLGFPRNWGLGSSSTLINNLARLAGVDPFELLDLTFGGSGYDLACAQQNQPLLYNKIKGLPHIEKTNFSPPFASELFFVHLNKKQSSKKAIQQYRENKDDKSEAIVAVSKISRAMALCDTLADFEALMEEHERIVSSVLGQKPVKEELFNAYPGSIKSLGAWGGDFMLATRQSDALQYFKGKGYETVIPYSQMTL